VLAKLRFTQDHGIRGVCKNTAEKRTKNESFLDGSLKWLKCWFNISALQYFNMYFIRITKIGKPYGHSPKLASNKRSFLVGVGVETESKFVCGF
jgi:hypothetical protein